MPTSIRTAMPGPRRSLRPRAIRGLAGVGIGLALGMLALGCFIQWDTRQDTWFQAERASDNVLVILEQDIARNMATIDLSMLGVTEALAQPDIDRIGRSIRHQALFDRAATAEDLGSVLVLDKAGEVVEDSTSLVPHSLNLASRDYFRAQRDDPNLGLYLSRPFRSRLRSGDSSISLSRRLPSAGGEFTGIVTSALRLTYFQHLFERLQLGKDGGVALLRTDGHVITRFPGTEADIDRDISGSPIFKQFLGQTSGHYVGSGSIDGIERLYTFRQVRGLPLILTVGVSVHEIFAGWKAKTWLIGTILLLLSGATMALCLLFRRELLRREAAERALEDVARELAGLAALDGLTGLRNRREFEQAFRTEWVLAAARQTPIGLLMLDADCFKLYNDHYGHPAGDRVLRSIAACLADQTRSGIDLCARYGGEEFVVILPRADARGTAITAERIRQSVEALGIEHAEMPGRVVTVSIGVAVLTPMAGDQPGLLLKAADDALYSAKHAGRNCVRAADFSVGVELSMMGLCPESPVVSTGVLQTGD